MPKRWGNVLTGGEGWPRARHSGKQRISGLQVLPGHNRGYLGVQETGLCEHGE